jgi:hypothetical protein
MDYRGKTEDNGNPPLSMAIFMGKLGYSLA